MAATGHAVPGHPSVHNTVETVKTEFAKLLLLMTLVSLLAPFIIGGIILGAALTA